MIPLLLKPRTALCLLTLLLLSIPYAGEVQGQETKPVARLITSSADVNTRPRRANKPETEDAKESTGVTVEMTPIEQRAFELTNEARVRSGLAPLVWDQNLCRMAREHSAKMAREKFFSHQTPQGVRLKDRARATGIGRFKVLAENIAFNQGFEDPGAFAVERWMISPGHRANILHPEFEASAVGVFVSDDGAVYLTQAFIAR